MNAPTTWMERFRDALRIMCNGKMPPLDLCERWVGESDDDLQGWVATNTAAWWSQGIVTIDSATTWADTPEEGAGHNVELRERRASCAAPLERRVGDWLPIEVAPIGRTHVQLYRPEIQFVGYYGGSESGWRINAPGLPSMWPLPTHWMPLPEAPNA